MQDGKAILHFFYPQQAPALASTIAAAIVDARGLRILPLYHFSGSKVHRQINQIFSLNPGGFDGRFSKKILVYYICQMRGATPSPGKNFKKVLKRA